VLENDMTDFHWDLFDRYLAGMATPAERKRFEEWLAADPERGNLVDAFRRAVDALELDVTEQEVEALWEGVAERAGVASQTSRKLHRDKAVTHRVGRVTSRRPAWRAGAGSTARQEVHTAVSR
jgi:anti-sigma factor RsiW